jgi:beta-galactosidase
LVEFKKTAQPVRAQVSNGEIVIENDYDFLELSHLTATFKVEEFRER